MKPVVALLNASDRVDATQTNFERDVNADVDAFVVTEGALPDSYAYDAVIVSGSPSSVYWDESWIPPLAAWVDGAIEAGVPVLGVCFGHQLVARVLGGEVRDMGEYELGYRTIERVGESALLSGLDEQFLAFTTHSDEVVTLPPGTEILAENDCSIHAFRAGHAFGVQFHPEYDRASAERVTRGKDLPDDRIREVLDGITEENVAAAADAKVVFDNFLDYVAQCGREQTEREGSDD